MAGPGNKPASSENLNNARSSPDRRGLLIVNADDLGRDALATDSCLRCFRRRRITSASTMVFMSDSLRAAELALEAGLETGLHINLVTPYDGPGVLDRVRRDQDLVIRFFRRGPWTQAVYHPLLTDALSRVFDAQREEYIRLIRKEPAHYDGHKHLHLSLNMILGKLLPPGTVVRRSFSLYSSGEGIFDRGYRLMIDRCYRRVVDTLMLKEHISTDAFFSLSPVSDLERLQWIMRLARGNRVELMAHTWDSSHYAFLMGEQFAQMTDVVRLGSFAELMPETIEGS